MRYLKFVLVLVIIVVVAAAIVIFSGIYNVAADQPHSGAIRALLSLTRSQSIDARLEDIQPPPDLQSQARIERGGRLYGEVCAQCHLGPGMEPTALHKGLNPQPPILTAHAGHHGAAEQFWIIKHGIKMTGMPAWGVSYPDEKLWDVTAFVKQLPRLSADEFGNLALRDSSG